MRTRAVWRLIRFIGSTPIVLLRIRISVGISGIVGDHGAPMVYSYASFAEISI